MLIFLPGSPLTTKFLSEKEKAMVVDRVKNNGTGVENKKFKWPQFGEAMMDPKTWLLFMSAVASNSPNEWPDHGKQNLTLDMRVGS